MSETKSEATVGPAVRERRLSPGMAKALSKLVFDSYNGSLRTLEDDDLLKAANILFPVYPPGQEVKAACLVLREWKETRATAQKPQRRLADLKEAAESGMRAWDRALDRLQYAERERRERWGFPEGRQYNLQKELHGVMNSGDPTALLGFFAEIQSRIGSAAMPSVPAPPPVVIPPELVAAIKKSADEELNHLQPYAKPVAAAKQTLSDYIFEIVTREEITYQKD